MSPTLVHVAPHPDDEAVGCPGSLLHLLDRGWTVVSIIASLGFPSQWTRRRAESKEAAERAGFVPVFLDPPLNVSLGDDFAVATDQVARDVERIVLEHQATIVVSPSPHDVHHAHEVVGRGVQRAVVSLPSSVRWWMWGVWGELPAPNVFFPFDETSLQRQLHILEAYQGELDRNNYRQLLSGRAMANAVLGSERVFGFGSAAASPLPYAEVLTEVRHLDGRWMASEPHHLDEGPAHTKQFDLDLSKWLDGPSVHDLVGPIREVEG